MQASAALIRFIPTFLTGALLLAGIVLMVVNRRSHGNAAMLGLVGCTLLLLGLLFNSVLGYFIPTLVRSSGSDTATVITLWTLGSFIFNVTGTGLLIWAVVARRHPPQDTQFHGPGGQQPWPPQYGERQA